MNKKRGWYSQREDDFIYAGIRTGRTAGQIAARLPGRDERSVAARAYKLGLSLAKERQIRIPVTGHVGIRVPDDPARTRWQNAVNTIVRATGARTMTEVVLHAIDFTSRQLKEQ